MRAPARLVALWHCCARRPRRDAPANRSGVPLRWRQAFEGTDAEPFAGGEGIVPGVEVVRRGGGPQPALLLEVRIDVMPRAELPEFLDRPLRAFAKEARLRPLQKPSKVPVFGHQDITKPPFLPEAPPPQTSCSSSRTRASGSSCLRVMAVQSPTKPPPTIATSAEWVPTRGAGGVGQVGRAHPVAGGQGGEREFHGAGPGSLNLEQGWRAAPSATIGRN